jgi:hypothetical protein
MSERVLEEEQRVRKWFELMTSEGYLVDIGQGECYKRDGEHCNLPPNATHADLFYKRHVFYRCGGKVWCIWIEDTFEFDLVCIAGDEFEEVNSIVAYLEPPKLPESS